MSEQLACRAEILAPGTKLGKYELIRRIAVGGMAELYLARATGIEGFQKQVALKRILPQHSGNEDFVSMFLDEARLVATLQHANIAQVYDIGQSIEGLFFTMEYVHGEDVRNLLRTTTRTGRRIPLEHVLSIAVGAAAGLHYAHEKADATGRALNIVHRDVSPSNVIVSYDGCVKLIDFGVAKAADRQTETRAGTLKGKISYMSPEQCEGNAIDRRSDVFSLGILLYEMTTGTRLFTGDNEFVLMKQIVYKDVEPPSKGRPSYPAPLEAIVLKALQRDPKLRYQSALELQLDLEAFARSCGIVISSANLGRYMGDVFADRIAMHAELDEQVARSSSGVGLNDEPSECDIQIVEEGAGSGPLGSWLFDAPEVIEDAASGRLGTSPVSSSVSPVLVGVALRRRRWGTLAGVIALVIAFALGFAVLVSGGGRSDVAATPVDAPGAEVPVPGVGVDVEPVPAAAVIPEPARQTATLPDAAQSAAEHDTATQESEKVTDEPAVQDAEEKKRERKRRTRSKRKKKKWDPDSAMPLPM